MSEKQLTVDTLPGIWYFGTISLSTDFTCSDTLRNFLVKKFTNFLYAVHEHGESGKKHFHFLGHSQVRTDNLKSSIKKQVEKETDDLTQYGFDFRPEPNFLWRLGYLMKEGLENVVVNLGFTDYHFRAATEAYAKKPKKNVKPLGSEKSYSKEQIYRYMVDNNITTRDGVIESIVCLKREGHINFSTFEKLNIKKLILFITERIDD